MVRIFFGLVFVGIALPFTAFAYTSPGAPDGYVTDFAHILSSGTIESLESDLAAFEASTTIEIAVVTIPTLGDDAIEVYANTLAREWGIGQEESNNGVLLLVAPNDRKVRIEVGYGLEGAIPDIAAGKIIDQIITPRFKQGDYDGGVMSGVEALKLLSEGEPFPESAPSPDDWLDTYGFVGFFILIFLINVLSGLGAILARSKSWWAGGVVGALGGGIIAYFFGLLFVGLTAVVMLAIIGALFDFIVSRNYLSSTKTGSTPPWYFGGSSGFGGGSRSSGSFGGGSFGGGGASGSW